MSKAPTKSEILSKILYQIEALLIEHKVVTQAELDEGKSKGEMSLSKAAGLMNQFLGPPYEAGQLREYVKDEIGTLEALAKMYPGAGPLAIRVRDGVLKNDELWDAIYKRLELSMKVIIGGKKSESKKS